MIVKAVDMLPRISRMFQKVLEGQYHYVQRTRFRQMKEICDWMTKNIGNWLSETSLVLLTVIYIHMYVCVCVSTSLIFDSNI
jgi:hypothetical protein